MTVTMFVLQFPCESTTQKSPVMTSFPADAAHADLLACKLNTPAGNTADQHLPWQAPPFSSKPRINVPIHAACV